MFEHMTEGNRGIGRKFGALDCPTPKPSTENKGTEMVVKVRGQRDGP